MLIISLNNHPKVFLYSYLSCSVNLYLQPLPSTTTFNRNHYLPPYPPNSSLAKDNLSINILYQFKMDSNTYWGPNGPYGVIDNEVQKDRQHHRKPKDQLVKPAANTLLPCVRRICYGYKCYHSAGRTQLRHATYQDWEECSQEGPRFLQSGLKYAKEGLNFLNMPAAYIEEYEYRVLTMFGAPQQQAGAHSAAMTKPWWFDSQNNRPPLLGSDTVK